MVQIKIQDVFADWERTTAERFSKLKENEEELNRLFIEIYEEKIHHLADQMIKIDLDDGVKHNYELFHDVLAEIKYRRNESRTDVW